MTPVVWSMANSTMTVPSMANSTNSTPVVWSMANSTKWHQLSEVWLIVPNDTSCLKYG